MPTNPTTGNVSYDDLVLGRCSIRRLLNKPLGVMGGYIATERRIIEVIRSYDDGRIAQCSGRNLATAGIGKAPSSLSLGRPSML